MRKGLSDSGQTDYFAPVTPITIVLCFLLLSVLLGIVLLRPAQATDIRTAEQVILPAEQEIDDDCLLSGRDVNIPSKVHGDITVAGASVVLAGPIHGDVLAAGATVRVTGPVTDDVRAVGGTIVLSQVIQDNAELAGGTVTTENTSRIGRDLLVVAGTTELKGNVGRNLILSGGDMHLSGKVGGNVKAYVQNITLEPGSVVKGDLIVRSPNPPVISPKATIKGRVDYEKAVSSTDKISSPVPSGRNGVGEWLGWWIFRFFSILILGSSLLALFPAMPDRVFEVLHRRMSASLAIGIAILVGIPIFALFLAVTLVGLPLALVLLAGYGIAALLSSVFLAYPLGRWLCRKGQVGNITRPLSPYIILASGAFALAFALSMPFLGGLIRFGILVAGMGAFFLERRNAWHSHVSVTVPTDSALSA